MIVIIQFTGGIIIIDIKINSKEVKQGDTFIAIKGVNNDGHNYIEEAISNGASKIICEYGNYNVETIHTINTTKYLEKYLKKHYYKRIKKLTLIGITGTSGKTTTSFLVYQMLKKLNQKVAYIGTIGFYMNNFIKQINNTTPSIYELYELLLLCEKNGIKYVVMEVSSHALALGRVNTLLFDEVAFTNISGEHLDYHKTIERYAKCKRKLFTKLRNDRISIINGDDEYSELFKNNSNKNILISSKTGDLVFHDIKYNVDGSSFIFDFDNNSYSVDISLIGEYNIYNYVTSILLVSNLGYSIKDIIKFNKEYKAPFGRMELIKYKTNYIYIDYAHKPNAVLNVLKTVSNVKTNKIITIIGCGGDRDKTKRPLMANISCKYSNYVIFTNDNPRTENEKSIINDMIHNIEYSNYEIILDRKTAIKRGIQLLKDNDILMILGKGHENYQIIGDKYYHLSDKEEVLKLIK